MNIIIKMVKSANLGFSRVGLNRELKRAVEKYWKKAITADELQNTAKNLRKTHWELQKDANIDYIPSNDFSFYDHILDMIATVGAVPKRYEHEAGKDIDLDLYFSMARGRQDGTKDVVAMEMTKWFDTNYHYIVPEFTKDTKFQFSFSKIIDQYLEAKNLGINTRPVIIGPVSFLLLGKSYDGVNKFDLLDDLLATYKQIIDKLVANGANWIQIDEPFLATANLTDELKTAYNKAYEFLGKITDAKLLTTTYFSDLRDNLKFALELPVAGLHFDLTKSELALDNILQSLPKDKVISLGLVNGCNIWKADIKKLTAQINKAKKVIDSDRIIIAPSCSLLHVPVDLDVEDNLRPELKSWLAFGKQKLHEVSLLTKIANEGEDKYSAQIEENYNAISSRDESKLIHNIEVKERHNNFDLKNADRDSDFNTRNKIQKEYYNFPLLPTTTIGSFPQTTEVRQYRSKFKKGEISATEYEKFLEDATKQAIKWQEDVDIDVLVHGEYERNDMVEYFGEQLNGYAFTKNGWVQSYGSRCVKPPVIFGDVSRPEPMTVRWSAFAQNLTKKKVKAMLTGPVTMLKWSFVRDDQPVSATCKQISLAIRDEVRDLEKAGIDIIQIDEPAFREAMPLRDEDHASYLKWAVDCFKISSSGIKDSTQIHTHMCYSEFNDIINAIADMDADVISIETSRSAMELLDAFVEFKYPNEVGPGVYDIHSPRIPKTQEMEHLLEKALDVLDKNQIWSNPDCGLKTRNWEEVKPALENMVKATKNIRKKLKDKEAATA
ncbi:5-methyltetrahydropteroyltriglutamate--homocysteine S-methyltransferase [Rickettsiales bacterium]|nr:5-methyltetrahydropteroyltriglutamate--homocysteine S-methyltransferase [Rickettsiales bacterium]